MKHNLALLDKAVALLEPRFTTRALRSIPALRKRLGDKGHAEDLAQVLRNSAILAPGQSPRLALISRRPGRLCVRV